MPPMTFRKPARMESPGNKLVDWQSCSNNTKFCLNRMTIMWERLTWYSIALQSRKELDPSNNPLELSGKGWYKRKINPGASVLTIES